MPVIIVKRLLCKTVKANGQRCRQGGRHGGMLDGKSALITGGGGGIGRATALVFAREGARVAVADAAEDAAQETVALVNAAGGQAMSLTGDVTDATRGAGDDQDRGRRVWPARLRVQQCRHRRVPGRRLRQEDR